MAQDRRFVFGAQLRNLPQALTVRVLDVSRFCTVAINDLKVGVFRRDRGRLVVSWNVKRGRKDARVFGDPSPEVDGEKVHAAGNWDGLHGVITDLTGIGVQKLDDRNRQFWQDEEISRITKQDLRVWPVYHWTDRRIGTYLAIAFMAYACVRHLAGRVAMQKRPMSPRVIREAFNDRQCSVLHDPENRKRYVIPLRPSAKAKFNKVIYATLGLDTSVRPYGLTFDGKGMKSARA